MNKTHEKKYKTQSIYAPNNDLDIRAWHFSTSVLKDATIITNLVRNDVAVPKNLVGNAF